MVSTALQFSSCKPGVGAEKQVIPLTVGLRLSIIPFSPGQLFGQTYPSKMFHLRLQSGVGSLQAGSAKVGARKPKPGRTRLDSRGHVDTMPGLWAWMNER